MYILLMIIHVIISVGLVMIILAQSSKGGALDGLVGGTASSMLGSHGASEFLSKWTKIIGAIWIISSLFLAMNVRMMTQPQRARALERLRRSEEPTGAVTDPDAPRTLEEMGEVMPSDVTEEEAVPLPEE